MQRQIEPSSTRTFNPESLITTKFTRYPVDNDDTVPFELFSAPYERIAVVPDSSPYELIEISRYISASTNLVAEDIDFDIDVEIEFDPPPRPPRFVAIVLLAGAFALGLGLAFLVF